MSYAVEWDPTAEQELSDIWMNAADPGEVTQAVNEVERRLKYMPLASGESRSGRGRVLFEPPLVVDYEVNTGSTAVVIRSVRSM